MSAILGWQNPIIRVFGIYFQTVNNTYRGDLDLEGCLRVSEVRAVVLDGFIAAVEAIFASEIRFSGSRASKPSF